MKAAAVLEGFLSFLGFLLRDFCVLCFSFACGEKESSVIPSRMPVSLNLAIIL